MDMEKMRNSANKWKATMLCSDHLKKKGIQQGQTYSFVITISVVRVWLMLRIFVLGTGMRMLSGIIRHLYLLIHSLIPFHCRLHHPNLLPNHRSLFPLAPILSTYIFIHSLNLCHLPLHPPLLPSSLRVSDLFVNRSTSICLK